MAALPGLGIKVKGAHDEFEIAEVPCLSSFVRFQKYQDSQLTRFLYGPILLFDVALRGTRSGYLQYFRSMPVEISQCYIFSETLEFLCIDFFGGQLISE